MQAADVVVKSVIGYAKTGSNGGGATASRGVSKTDARGPVVLGSFRRIEHQRLVPRLWNPDARCVRKRIERLPVLSNWRGGVLIANSGIESEVVSHPPSVVRIEVNGLLIAVVSARPSAALTEIVGRKVFQKNLGPVVLVVPAGTLREALR